jgi:hypothetical protein
VNRIVRTRQGGTDGKRKRFPVMSEPIPILIQTSLQIAWDFLARSGEITDPDEASDALLTIINALLLKGERRRLMLSNRAISEYRKLKAEGKIDAAA